MKKKTTIAFIIFTIALLSEVFSQTGENYSVNGNNFRITANGSYLIPIGALSDRLKPTIGFSLGFGQRTGENWEWIGKFEYFKFSKVNEENLYIKRKITTNMVENEYTIPISKLIMDLEVAGISANANVKLFSSEYLISNLSFGFGIYNWRSTRGEYYDSLFVTDSNGNAVFAEYLNVPELVQMDWSGGLSFGINSDIRVFGPLWLTLGANYKIIIAELWATLKLDIENVSGLQMGEVYSGFKFQF